jgi:hypothetical protein
MSNHKMIDHWGNAKLLWVIYMIINHETTLSFMTIIHKTYLTYLTICIY